MSTPRLDPVSTTSIIISELAPTTTENDIRTALESFGTITHINLRLGQKARQGGGCGYVSFKEASAVQTLNQNCVIICSKKVFLRSNHQNSKLKIEKPETTKSVKKLYFCKFCNPPHMAEVKHIKKMFNAEFYFKGEFQDQAGTYSGPYGVGYPRGKKAAYGRLGGGPPAGRIRVGHSGPV
jgi:hypothetical protein